MQFPKEFDRANPAPVLIAGATASGKSALALELAHDQPSLVINADALQVYEGWHILTARPSDADRAQVSHLLDGHVGMHQDYSVGHWLRDVSKVLSDHAGHRPIIVGGTGLYFRALTEGLAEIPPISDKTKGQADALEAEFGLNIFADQINQLDLKAGRTIDMLNPARTRRAWEVLIETGKSIVDWQAETPPALLPIAKTQALLLNSEPDWIADRINRRFDIMMDLGALDEARCARDTFWEPTAVSCQAIGAAELIDHLNGKIDLDTAIDLAKTKTRQFAKRQRTWFRSRMRNWTVIELK
ncbi:MAG: tRNA (adenosine(37)-N6)-dimethylallyltransferase MiaA [Pseudomonadota bacterium]